MVAGILPISHFTWTAFGHVCSLVELASKMLGDFLITKQTPPGGVKVNKVRNFDPAKPTNPLTALPPE